MGILLIIEAFLYENEMLNRPKRIQFYFHAGSPFISMCQVLELPKKRPGG